MSVIRVRSPHNLPVRASVVAISMTTVLAIEPPVIIAVGAVGIVMVTSATAVIAIEPPVIIAIGTVGIVMVTSATAVIAIEPPVIIAVGAVRIVMVTSAIACIMMRPQPVAMFCLAFRIQVVVVIANNSTMIPAIGVSGSQHPMKYVANAASLSGILNRRSVPAVGSCLVIPPDRGRRQAA